MKVWRLFPAPEGGLAGKRQNRTLVSFRASFVQDPVTLMTLTLVELLMKKTPFAWMTLGAWIFSLCLPMIYSDGRLVFGVQLFIMGFAALPFFFFALLHILMWATNFLLLVGVAKTISSSNHSSSKSLPPVDPWLLPVGLAIAANLALGIGLATGENETGGLPGLLSLPGFYVWLSSFMLLAVALMRRESRHVASEDLK